MFWGMPRRIRLNLDNLEEMTCGVCGRSLQGHPQLSSEELWCKLLRSLAPSALSSSRKDGVPLPVHAQPGGVSYRHWLGLVQEDDKLGREPALVVHHFREYRQNSGSQFRLWAFGYDMDNMKARCWYESVMPLIPLSKAIREPYEQKVAGIVRAASEVGGNLRTRVKKAWFRRPGDIKGNISFVDADSLQSTEAAFYARLNS